MSVQLSDVEIMRVCAVLQDCADQLAVLGNIMPGSQKGQALLSEATQELITSHKQLNCLMDENLFPDKFSKVQRDREFVSHVIAEVMTELQQKGTFYCLLKAVEEEKKKKIDLQNIIISEEESRVRVNTLQKQLHNIHKEKMIEVERRNKLIAKFKDQLQETQKKCSVEKKYIEISTEHLIKQHQKLNDHMEKELEDEKMILQEKLSEEKRSNTHMESFLKKHLKYLEDKLEYWTERYEIDMKDKQQQIYNLNIKFNNNKARIDELAKKHTEYEQVITEYHQEKKKIIDPNEVKKAVLKIQAWWRKIQMKKGLGPYKKAKKPKGKGKGKGKGKK